MRDSAEIKLNFFIEYLSKTDNVQLIDVLVILKLFIDKEKPYCNSTNDQIAAVLRCSESTVKRKIRCLAKLGVIDLKTKTYNQRSTRYIYFNDFQYSSQLTQQTVSATIATLQKEYKKNKPIKKGDIK